MSTTPERSPRPARMAAAWVAAAVLVSVALRLGLMGLRSGTFDDPDNYLPLARSLAAGEGLSLKGRPTAYRPPLYPLVLAPIVTLLGDRPERGVALLHLALGAATVGLTSIAAARYGLGPARVATAAWIVALDPVLAWQARSVMTETLSAALVAAALAALTVPGRNGAVLGGGTLGLCALCRPSLLPAGALTVLAALLVGPGDLRRRAGHALVMGMTVLLTLAPWAIRNATVLGEPVWTTTHGGYTLALANNEVYYRDVLQADPGRVWTGRDQWFWWDSVNSATAGMTEPEADRFLRDGVIRLARERPGTFLIASADRLARFWSFAPASAVYGRAVRWGTAAWTVPLGVALVLGLCRRSLWRWPEIAAPLQLAGLSAVHCLYWTDLRMRAPIVPAIAVIAAAACVSFRRARDDRSLRDQEATTSSGSAA
ncbi:MAG: dolichyl-phosphate-mannose-protein mannosyltransferase [Isosphaeraceae bacterium]